ncbi:uncharacterized protein BDR25DRAFT_5966 [Lindgomyces ingoldianus]|uniref:Uncharacterized protein n=1 Tax=Lindgomyces ingoldianus TaxID=673940 RepID=A0ACB6RI06_9PLEO|nr:uncharacterized protein BDR25DRAFT_5966 [Lindgomyces ingoldianus]KAF2477965.1 hypothetical protein BDR25DRAFT_5966 [Lindgomyces ingoldianus]
MGINKERISHTPYLTLVYTLTSKGSDNNSIPMPHSLDLNKKSPHVSQPSAVHCQTIRDIHTPGNCPSSHLGPKRPLIQSQSVKIPQNRNNKKKEILVSPSAPTPPLFVPVCTIIPA